MKKAIFLVAVAALFTSCHSENESVMKKDLSQNWEFSQAGKDHWLSAEVPGTVHTDLMNHELIPDPFIGKNEDSVQWIENEDWLYRSHFRMTAKELENRVTELVFEGLDTYAEVSLNGTPVINADNMFIEWTADCSNILKEGENSLEIRFNSPVRIGLEKASKLDYLLVATNEQAPDDEKTNVFTRKAPFHFGWDWGPRLVTSGIWRPVYLRSWDRAKISDIFFRQDMFSKTEARYTAVIEFESLSESEYSFALSSDNVQIAIQNTASKKGKNTIELAFSIENPELWWPNGLGDQHLYNLRLDISDSQGHIQSVDKKLGVREIKLVQNEDIDGRSFYFRVNGIPVFMKGANYIPGDILLTRVDPAKYARVIRETTEANMNMLRVWGGAIYENDLFYDLCDENGILVWQDFMFACAMQPGDSAHLENIRKEAVYNVKRLRNHACMALWCGNNENLTAWINWNWQDNYTEEQNEFHWKTYQEIFYHILAEAVSENHPGMSYWPSSPQTYDNRVADRKSGDEHDWSIWFGIRPFLEYGVNVPRFVSEYGLQSFPEMQTIMSFAGKEDLMMFSDLFNHRQRSRMDWIKPGYNGNHMQLQYQVDNFGEPSDFEDFLYGSQITHQLGMKEAIEAHRRNMPHCMGSLYWQINDCWPTISWASVDFYGNWKACHYQAKRSFENLIIAESILSDNVDVYIVSDLLEDIPMELNAYWITNKGEKTGEAIQKQIMAEANSSTLVLSTPKTGASDRFLVVSLTSDGKTVAEKIIIPDLPKNMVYEKPVITTRIVEDDEGKFIEAETDIPAFFVQIGLSDNESILLSDNYFHILPGKAQKVRILSDSPKAIDSSSIIHRSYYGR